MKLAQKTYKQEISKYLKNNNIYFYWKARVALYAILKAINVKKGDEIVLPAYTCVVVPNAILYLGAKPVYVDVDKDTYNASVKSIKSAVTKRTKAIICQNTYGLSTDVEKISVFGKKNKIFTIEDCAHGFGGTYNKKPNGTYCDAAFYSTQWNKPYSTGIGGFALINNDKLISNIEKVNQKLVSPGFLEQVLLFILIKFHKYFLNSNSYWFLMRLYRWLSSKNLILGSSSKNEVKNIIMPENYFKTMGNVQIKQGIHSIKKLEESLKLRKTNSIMYTKFLKKNQKNYIKEKYFKNHSFLKYPILVRDRKSFINLAEKEHIKLGDWFISPLHPVVNNLKLWNFKIENYPNSKYISSSVINLSTDESNIEKILLFLEKNIKNII
ncbi:MAG: DegT/DnrJ/EryC1/StrS aminotransferase family protein [Spirochaetia bacterium]|nr:DegT/DnrJ/EryC1/StrS aminotransferase family protein [Spirochaetia bacterium]